MSKFSKENDYKIDLCISFFNKTVNCCFLKLVLFANRLKHTKTDY